MKNINKLADKVGKMVVRNNIGSRVLAPIMLFLLILIILLTAPILKIFLNLEENFQNPPPEVPQGPKLTLYYASWCPASQQFLETWEELKKLNLGPLEEVECSTEGNKQKCADQNIKTVPTLKYVENGETKIYDGSRDLQDLKNLLNRI